MNSCNNTEKILINAQIVELLMTMRMKDAAEYLGISDTTLKRACRKLGIEKWKRQSSMQMSDPFIQNTSNTSIAHVHAIKRRKKSVSVGRIKLKID